MIGDVLRIEDLLRAQLHGNHNSRFMVVYDDSRIDENGTSLSKSYCSCHIRSRQICREDICNPLRHFTPQISPERSMLAWISRRLRMDMRGNCSSRHEDDFF